MNIQFPSILCAVESANRESIRSIPSEYELTFAQNEFDAVEMAREHKFKLILMTCQSGEQRYARACRVIRLFDETTPILFITGPNGLTEGEAIKAGGQGVICEGDQDFAADLEQRIARLVEDETLVFKAKKI